MNGLICRPERIFVCLSASALCTEMAGTRQCRYYQGWCVYLYVTVIVETYRI